MDLRKRHSSVRRQIALLTAGIILGLTGSARAVIVATGDGRNLTPPPAPLLTAWNLQGQFGQFLGTPISATQMITAAHVTDPPRPFTYNGHTYTMKAAYTDVPDSDLRIWTIDTDGDPTTFSTWSPLWNEAVDGSEVGKEFVVFGRGRARGEAIYAPLNAGPFVSPGTPTVSVGAALMTYTGGSAASTQNTASQTSTAALAAALSGPSPQVPAELRGWKLGAADLQQSWGKNVVDAIQNVDDPSAPENQHYGDLLIFDFDGPNSADAVANEGGLAQYDSGGGVFIYSTVANAWKLAGINLGVESGFASTPQGLYDALSEDGMARNSIIDASGLYTFIADGPDADSDPDIGRVGYGFGPLTVANYSSRISSHLSEILGLLAAANADSPGNGVTVPEPTSAATLMTIAAAVAARRRRR